MTTFAPTPEPIWHYACGQCTPTRAAYVVAFNAVFMPIAVLCKRRWAVALAVVAIVVDIYFHQVPAMGVSLNFYAHCILGVGCLQLGGCVLRTTDGLVTISPLVGAFTSAFLIFASVSTVIKRGLAVLHEQVHVQLYMILMILVVSMALPGPVERRRPEWSEPLLAIRKLLDPVTTFSLGVLSYSHLHDISDLGLAVHRYMGYYVMLVAVVQFCSILAHGEQGSASPKSRAFTLLHSFLWLLSGIALLHMAIFLYIFGHGGVHQMLYKRAGKALPDGNEEALSYLALDMMLTALLLIRIVVVMRRSGAWKDLGGSQEVVCASDADGLGAPTAADEGDDPRI